MLGVVEYIVRLYALRTIHRELPHQQWFIIFSPMNILFTYAFDHTQANQTDTHAYTAPSINTSSLLLKVIKLGKYLCLHCVYTCVGLYYTKTDNIDWWINFNACISKHRLLYHRHYWSHQFTFAFRIVVNRDEFCFHAYIESSTVTFYERKRKYSELWNSWAATTFIQHTQQRMSILLFVILTNLFIYVIHIFRICDGFDLLPQHFKRNRFTQIISFH